MSEAQETAKRSEEEAKAEGLEDEEDEQPEADTQEKEDEQDEAAKAAKAKTTKAKRAEARAKAKAKVEENECATWSIPEAGWIIGKLSRNASYAAADRGEFGEIIWIGDGKRKLARVIKRPLQRKLGLIP